jgi:hypothetical protein
MSLAIESTWRRMEYVLSELWRLVEYKLEQEEPGYRSRYSDWLRAGRLRVRSSSPGRFKNSLLKIVQTGSEVHPTTYPMGTRGSFPWVKRPGREADHWPPASAEVKKMWIYTSTPPYAFMAQCLIRWAQGQLYLLPLHIRTEEYRAIENEIIRLHSDWKRLFLCWDPLPEGD